MQPDQGRLGSDLLSSSQPLGNVLDSNQLKDKRVEDGSADDCSRARQVGGMGVVFKVSGADTGGAFAVGEHPIEPGRLVLPHVHVREDEYSYVLEGTIGARVGDHEIVAGPSSLRRTLLAGRTAPGRPLRGRRFTPRSTASAGAC